MRQWICRRPSPIWQSLTLHSLRRDEPGIAQPAYMAAQNARLAQLRGAAKADDARVAAGQAERDSIVLAARTNQVDSANRAKDARESRRAATQIALRDDAKSPAIKRLKTPRGCRRKSMLSKQSRPIGAWC